MTDGDRTSLGRMFSVEGRAEAESKREQTKVARKETRIVCILAGYALVAKILPNAKNEEENTSNFSMWQ